MFSTHNLLEKLAAGFLTFYFLLEELSMGGKFALPPFFFRNKSIPFWFVSERRSYKFRPVLFSGDRLVSCLFSKLWCA
jgi:hypothetical protein